MAEIKQNQIVEEPVISTALLKGVDVIKGYLKSLPSDPGVYRMINLEGDVLYVGKAKNLKKRVSNYAHPGRQSIRKHTKADPIAVGRVDVKCKND